MLLGRMGKIFIRNCRLPKRTLRLVVNSVVILYNTISKRSFLYNSNIGNSKKGG